MELVLPFIGGIVVGLFGGVGLERYRNAQKHQDHRQDNYHQLLGATDARAIVHNMPPTPGTATQETREQAERFPHFRRAMEVFGPEAAKDAARDLDAAFRADDEKAMWVARERLVEVMRKDVGPRAFLTGRRL